MSTRTVETVGEFAEYIKETEIEGAKELFEAYAGKLGMLWERFSTQCITPYSLRNLMNSISRFVSITPFRDIKPL